MKFTKEDIEDILSFYFISRTDKLRLSARKNNEVFEEREISYKDIVYDFYYNLAKKDYFKNEKERLELYKNDLDNTKDLSINEIYKYFETKMYMLF